MKEFLSKSRLSLLLPAVFALTMSARAATIEIISNQLLSVGDPTNELLEPQETLKYTGPNQNITMNGNTTVNGVKNLALGTFTISAPTMPGSVSTFKIAVEYKVDASPTIYTDVFNGTYAYNPLTHAEQLTFSGNTQSSKDATSGMTYAMFVQPGYTLGIEAQVNATYYPNGLNTYTFTGFIMPSSVAPAPVGVPEPQTFAFGALGLAVVGGVSRFRFGKSTQA